MITKLKVPNLLFRSFATITSVSLIILTITLSGCGGGETKESDQDTTSASDYTPANSSASYDPARIDPNAPVMNVNLEALGNSMDVMKFSTQEIRVKAGTTVKLHFVNSASDSAMKHNFFIVKNGTMEQVANDALSAGVDKNFIPDDKTNLLYTSNVLSPGRSEDLVFPAPPSGEYQFVCTYPGHWQKMNGKFIVE